MEMETTYENILPIVNPFSHIEKPFTTTIYRNWHTIVIDTTPSTIWPSKPLSTYTKPSHSQPFCLLHTNTWFTTTQFLTQLLTYTYIHPHIETHSIVGTPPPFLQGRRLSPQPNFQKGGGGLTGPQLLEEDCWERGSGFFIGERGRGCNFHIKIN